MKVFRKPNPWFTIYFVTMVVGGPFLVLLHVVTFGAFNGIGVGEAWIDYTATKGMNWDENR